MNNKHIKISLAILLLAFSLNSCKVTQTYQRPELSSTDNLYRGAGNSSDTLSIANLPYQMLFSDSILKRLP